MSYSSIILLAMSASSQVAQAAITGPSQAQACIERSFAHSHATWEQHSVGQAMTVHSSNGLDLEP